MSSQKLIVPQAFLSFYEQKKEMAITKEEELFFHKVFQYALRMANGLTSSNRHSFNQKALAQTACAWLEEYQLYYEACKKTEKSCYLKSKNVPQRHTYTRPERIITHSEILAETMQDALGGLVYTEDNQYTMMRIQSEPYNEKRRREHRYPRAR